MDRCLGNGVSAPDGSAVRSEGRKLTMGVCYSKPMLYIVV